jgi:hypothetical protein
MGCYICGEPATSVEHAPAKCFFPSDKRVNLTTVDSCSLHNEATSKDDEYVRNVIAMTIGNNNVALRHFLDTCIKSFIRSPKLLQATTSVNKTVYVKEQEGEDIKPTYAFKIDRSRIDLVLRKIAYATFFKKYNTTWNRELIIGTEYLRTSGIEADDLGLIIQNAKKVLDQPVYEGNNQEVFRFSFQQTDTEDINDQILIMSFYEGFEVWIFPINDSTGPKI